MPFAGNLGDRRRHATSARHAAVDPALTATLTASRALTALAGAALAVMSGCGGGEADPVASCRRAHERLTSDSAPHVVAVCRAAYEHTHDAEALVTVAKAELARGNADEVLRLASSMPDEPAYARLWHLAGDAESRRGHRDEARHWYERTLVAQQDRDPLRAFNTALALSDDALAENDLGHALSFALVAVRQAEAAGEDGARARAAMALADLLVLSGDHRAAGRVLAQSEQAASTSPTARGYYLATRGEIARRDGKPVTARAAYERCLVGLSPEDDPLVGVRCRLHLVALLLGADHALGEELALRRARATQLLRAATDQRADVARVYGPDAALDSELALARGLLLHADGAVDQAIAALTELGRRDLPTWLRARTAYQLGMMLAERERVDEAEVALQDAADAVERLRDGAHYRELREALAEELRAPYEALFELRLRRGAVPGALAAMERAITRDFIDGLAAEPGLAADRDSVEGAVALAIDRSAVRARLDRRVATLSGLPIAAGALDVIAFFSARGRLWRVRLPAGGQPSIDEVGTLEELAASLAALRTAPTTTAAARAGARLLPASLLPARDRPLVIVPDRAIAGVRFAALPVGHELLVERNPVAIAPTLRLATAQGGEDRPSRSVVLGDPTGDLPAAHAEAEEVAALLGVPAHVGGAAVRAQLAGAAHAAVLHIASHGDHIGGRGVLHLADGDLSVTDLLALDLAPRLAVIASCTSANQASDRMWTSLAAGLLAGGARGVIGVQGRLPDDEGRALVRSFYAHGGASAPVRGLALAQRDAIARDVPVEVWSMLMYLGTAETTATVTAHRPSATGEIR